MIRFLGFLSEARNKPPLHAMNNGLFTLSAVPSPKHRQIRPRRHIIRRPVPKKTNLKMKTYIDFTEETVNRKAAIWRVRVCVLPVHLDIPSWKVTAITCSGDVVMPESTASPSTHGFLRYLPSLSLGILREMKGESAGSDLAVSFSFAGRWMCVDLSQTLRSTVDGTPIS